MFSCHSGVLLAFKLAELYPADRRQCGQEPPASLPARALFSSSEEDNTIVTCITQVSGGEKSMSSTQILL